MMFTYTEAKEYLIEHLTRDIKLHNAGDYSRIGDGFGEFDINLPRDADPKFSKLHIALNFWDGWQDSRNHYWEFYQGILQNDWPRLATVIIQNIEEETEITNELILEHFGLRPRESIVSKLKKMLNIESRA